MSEKRMGETKERLEQIFRDYYQLIYRVAFSQVKNHADAGGHYTGSIFKDYPA